MVRSLLFLCGARLWWLIVVPHQMVWRPGSWACTFETKAAMLQFASLEFPGWSFNGPLLTPLRFRMIPHRLFRKTQIPPGLHGVQSSGFLMFLLALKHWNVVSAVPPSCPDSWTRSNPQNTWCVAACRHTRISSAELGRCLGVDHPDTHGRCLEEGMVQNAYNAFWRRMLCHNHVSLVVLTDLCWSRPKICIGLSQFPHYVGPHGLAQILAVRSTWMWKHRGPCTSKWMEHDQFPSSQH